MIKTLREYIKEAEEKKIAIGHFNVSNSDGIWGVFRPAQKLGLPIIIGVSEGERDFIGVRQIASIIKSIREEYDYPIFLNADHTYSFERVKEVVDAGFDAVIFDGAQLSFEENVEATKKCKEYIMSTRPEVILEAEMGYIGTSSKILDEIPEGVSFEEESLTNPQKAKEFVEATGIDLLAPSVGNVHGMFRSGKNPKLNINLIKRIRESAGVPLVLHGGSGSSEEDFKEAIVAGMPIVHINTEIRVAYKQGIVQSLQENPDEVAPYKFLKNGVKNIEEVVEKKLKLFSNIS